MSQAQQNQSDWNDKTVEKGIRWLVYGMATIFVFTAIVYALRLFEKDAVVQEFPREIPVIEEEADAGLTPETP